MHPRVQWVCRLSVHVWMRACVCVCVREEARMGEQVCVCVSVYLRTCVYPGMTNEITSPDIH